MLIIKNFILIFILIISTYIGFYKSKEYIKRVEELKKYENALNMFKAKIEFTYAPIKEIFENISKSIYQNQNNIFKMTIENLKYKDISEVWINSIENYDGSLNKEDKEIIKMFGKLLGKTDKNGQISEIKLSQNFIEAQIEKAEIEKLKNVKLYRSLGIIVGLGIIVIFI